MRLTTIEAITTIIERIAARLKRRTIDHYGDPYLSRHALLRAGSLFRAYLHRFHRPDADPEHHSHPWPFAVSIILVGGYTEERLEGGRVVTRERRPGSVHVLRSTTYHRVARLHGDAVWTLFVPFGRNTDAWSFRHPASGETTPWRRFIERQGRRIA